MNPELLPLDNAATRWSVPSTELDQALATRPLLVLMHGYASNEADLAGLFDLLPAQFVIASLRAPLPAPIPGGAAWFPLDPERLGNPDPRLANAATRGVLRWLERTRARVRTPGSVSLLGFSQGGAMATQLLRHHPEAFTSAVVLSGFVVPGLLGGDEALAQIRPPVFWGHDTADPVIPTEAADRLGVFLAGHTTLTARTYPGAGHGITAEEMDDVVRFLNDQVTAVGA